MNAFYAELIKGGDPRAAMVVTQREQMGLHPAKSGLARSIKFAGAFILTGSGE